MYRFGSFGSEHERPDSDLAVSLPTVKLWHTAQELVADVGRDVDIVDLGAAMIQTDHEERRGH